MAQTLTHRSIERLQPRGQQYDVWDSATVGFGVRVTAAGAKIFTVRYRINGRLRRYTIGPFSNSFTLAKARRRAEAVLGQVANNVDPAQVKIEERKAEQQRKADKQQTAERFEAESFEALAHAYIEKYAKKQKRSWKADERMLRKEVLPHWRKKRAREITRWDVTMLVEAIAERGAGVFANRVVAMLSKLFTWALQTGRLDASPAAKIVRPGQETKRQRALTDAEVRDFWRTCDSFEPTMAAFYRLRLITAQRGIEVNTMRWADIENLNAGSTPGEADPGGSWWMIPEEVVKNKRPHRVWLSVMARDIVRELRARVDVRLAAQPDPDERKEPTYVLEGARGKRQQAEAAKAFTIENFKGHDLRRTAATNMRRAGVSRVDVSRVLNHMEPGSKATEHYVVYDNASEKQIALDTWAAYLAGILKRDPNRSEDESQPARAQVLSFARG